MRIKIIGFGFFSRTYHKEIGLVRVFSRGMKIMCDHSFKNGFALGKLLLQMPEKTDWSAIHVDEVAQIYNAAYSISNPKEKYSFLAGLQKSKATSAEAKKLVNLFAQFCLNEKREFDIASLADTPNFSNKFNFHRAFMGLENLIQISEFRVKLLKQNEKVYPVSDGLTFEQKTPDGFTTETAHEKEKINSILDFTKNTEPENIEKKIISYTPVCTHLNVPFRVIKDSPKNGDIDTQTLRAEKEKVNLEQLDIRIKKLKHDNDNLASVLKDYGLGAKALVKSEWELMEEYHKNKDKCE